MVPGGHDCEHHSIYTSYGAMISTILDEVPENIRASTTAMTMFAVNVLVIGLATYGLGFASDLFANMGRDEP